MGQFGKFMRVLRIGIGPALVLIVCSGATAAPTAVATAIVQVGTWRAPTTAFGQVVPRRDATLNAPLTARVRSIEVEVGQRVVTGQALLHFTSPELERDARAYANARTALVVAERRMALLEDGEKRGVIAGSVVLAWEAQLLKNKAQREDAWSLLAADFASLGVSVDREAFEKRLDKEGTTAVAARLGVLRAPFDGVITARMTAPGELVNGTRPLLALEDWNQVYIDVGIPRESLEIWSTGKTMVTMAGRSITLDSTDGAAIYDSAVGLWTRRYKADNGAGALGDGAWIKVVHLSPPVPVLWVPESAVVSRQGKAWCIVANGSGADGAGLHPVAIRVGPAQAGRVPVLHGLKAGDRVVTEGAYELLYRDLKELVIFNE